MSGDNEKKFTAIMIVEVMGRPKEHLVETLENISKEISEEKGVKLQSKKINEPSLVKDQEDLFTTFAELEVEVDEPIILSILMFKYMPSHVEVVEPEKFVLTNVEYSDILNELTRRLHRYEELVKVMQFQMESQAKPFPRIQTLDQKIQEANKKNSEKEEPNKESKK